MRTLALLLLLAACAEFPVLDARIPAAERAAPPPALVPLTGLLSAADALPPSPGFAPGLAAEAQALAGRATGLAPATPDPEVASRAAALEARAAALPASRSAEDAARLAALEARAQAIRDGTD